MTAVKSARSELQAGRDMNDYFLKSLM